ncbi:MAG: DUF3054 domain-containing protein [Acidimicrobiia bacterium]
MRTAAIVGDVAVIVILTVVGFATHETLGQTGRLLVTIGAFLAAWAFVAPWFGSFDSGVIRGVRRVWVVSLAWIAAAPLGAVVRGLVLGIDVSPIFVVVMTVVTGAGLVLWRVILAFVPTGASES